MTWFEGVGMEPKEESFLRTLHFHIFENSKEEQRLMGNHEFDSENAAIRNDQKISSVREVGKMLNQIVKDYLEACER